MQPRGASKDKARWILQLLQNLGNPDGDGSWKTTVGGFAGIPLRSTVKIPGKPKGHRIMISSRCRPLFVHPLCGTTVLNT